MNTTLKQVAAYQTQDGKTFPDKIVALKHNFKLDMKGLVRQGLSTPRTNDSYTSQEVAEILLKNEARLTESLKKLRVAIGNAERFSTKKSATSAQILAS